MYLTLDDGGHETPNLDAVPTVFPMYANVQDAPPTHLGPLLADEA